MKILVNSDRTIKVNADLVRHVVEEATELLDRFAERISRVEIHLSDIDMAKTGKIDKRCLVEVRPTAARPLVATAVTKTIESAVNQAMRKMVRELTTYFGRTGRLQKVSIPKPVVKQVSPVKKTAAKKAATAKAAAKTTKLSSRGPKKKTIYQARRRSWPKM